jgi:hypothetical protein
MKTRDALFDDIVRYARTVWRTGDIRTLDPLVRLMTEEICSELHLLYGRLDGTDVAVREKLIETLSPSGFDYVRPGHAAIHVSPGAGSPKFRLERTAGFHVGTPPAEFKERNIGLPLFTPVADTEIRNISIVRLFYGNTLWATDVTGARKLLSRSDKKAEYNTVWLGLETDPSLRTLNDLPFYIDFPHLRGDHPYFDLMPELRWMFRGKPLKTKPGFPAPPDAALSDTEKHILHFYEDLYRTVPEIRTDDVSGRNFPCGPAEITPPETGAPPKPLHWLSIAFPPYFAEEDLERVRILLNVFPAVNRYYGECHLSAREDLTGVVSLPSGAGEEFLEIDRVVRRAGKESRIEKRYTAVPVGKDAAGVSGLSDRLERLIDVVRNERRAFPSGIDVEKLMEIFNSVSSGRDGETFVAGSNRLRENAEVARLALRTEEETSGVSVYYWNTHAGLPNGLPAGTVLTAHRIPELNRAEAVFITPVSGGRSFLDRESGENILHFYLTSGDRILTGNDIVNFCRMELGDAARDVRVSRGVRISPKSAEGMVSVVEIRIFPRAGHVGFLQSCNVLKDLRLRLRQRSPESFGYVIEIAEERED